MSWVFYERIIYTEQIKRNQRGTRLTSWYHLRWCLTWYSQLTLSS